MSSIGESCPLCGSSGAEAAFTVRDVPVICNQLWPDAAAARAAPVGDVELVICPDCALMWNRAFEPERMVYAPGYENALHFSPRFKAFAEALAADLVVRRDLAGRHVVEIGCGDGHMLDLMVKHGAATATGFDPSMAGRTSPFTARDGVEIVPEYFLSERLDRHVDAILCRHVVEHLDAPLPFFRNIRNAIGARPVPIYVEVPNAGWMLESVSMWDVIYEHVTYWTAPAMETLFRRTGFRPTRIGSGYGDQFLMAEGTAAQPEPDYLSPDTSAALAAARAFAAEATTELSQWRDRLSSINGSAVIWGAGSKGITFANALGPDAAGALAALVDLNPRKHGLAVPGVALPVVGPEALRDIRPDLVVISNAIYEKEIRDHVRSLGLEPDFAIIAG